ncbi:ATP-binding cassette domain-containing protein [Dethiosulfatarculus sandiegensis]|uniref:ATP-binding cassette domain-containing protein n=1 Tax=Dethiosulfatarculus sandiegensis TaxID=1429043 RepID=UPI0005C9F39B|nr:ATP-binding cassette domain-containing protein [Dethiosulfatarculus sandiegensis]
MSQAAKATCTGNKTLLDVSDITKRYNKTVALNNCNIHLSQGEILGLIGGNGAGKSTLTRVISGITKPDKGDLVFAGQNISFNEFNPHSASALGIKVVYQELSLCTNLTVYENFLVDLEDLFKGSVKWRNQARKIARKTLDAVFPDNGIDVDERLDTLAISQQQMVEIARAFTAQNLRLLILDEPTSSLPEEQTNQLLAYIKKKKREGMACIYISHRLKEVESLVDRISIIDNGQNIWCGPIEETSEEDMLCKMMSSLQSADGDNGPALCRHRKIPGFESVGITAHSYSDDSGLNNLSFHMSGGEIIGIAGLEGNGQKELLHKLFEARQNRTKNIEVKGRIAYVTGDRKKEGIFYLWHILQNMMITKLSFGRLFKTNNEKEITDHGELWSEKLKIKCSDIQAPITDLSGGNQQKVLVARAMLADPDIIILDDPTRGVDVATKRQIYDLLIEAAKAGKLIILYSTDNLELEICNRTLVMRYGTIVKELADEQVTQDNLVEASFMGEELKPIVEKKQDTSHRKWFSKNSAFIPFIAMMLMYIACGLKSPAVFSLYGVNLLLSGAAPLIILSLAQMYIIGLGHIELGVGNFLGLINVLCATLLFSNTPLGILALLGFVFFYACMGLIIYHRNIPAIIMTLGASFVWKGLSLTIQESPGGKAPEWLTHLFWLDTDFPVVFSIILLISIASYLFYRSKYGTVLKAFGNNPLAMVRSGWSQAKAFFSVYLTAGIITLLAGLVLSGINGASDGSASETYTMQTIAAVVVGGGYLLGGFVSIPGAIFGAVTFSLISFLLGFFKISTELTAAIQGFILIVILSLRVLKKGRIKS